MSYTSELPARTFLKPSEASALFNVPLDTIYFWYRMGNIDGFNVNGKCLRIFSASLQEFLGSRVALGGEDLMWGRLSIRLTGGIMLGHHSYEGTQTVRRKGGKNGRVGVITSLDVELLGVIAAMMGVLADAARKSATMREHTHVPVIRRKTSAALGA